MKIRSFIFFLLLSFFCYSGECAARVIHVTPDFSIQEAINDAMPGDTVKVAEGRYRANIRMRKGINLIGAGAGKSKIKPIDDKTKAPIVVTADHCLLEGFTFLRGTKNSPGAILVENTSPTIRNNVIKRNQTAGILIKFKDANPLIERNRIYKNKTAGIKAIGSGGRIIANEIFANAGPGISLLDSYPTIVENYIYRNRNTGITTGAGGMMQQPGEPREAFIHKNKIEDNNSAGVATESCSPTITYNTISNKGKPSILLFSSNSVVKNNVLTSNGPPVIRINNSSSPIVENNIISGTLRFPIMNDSQTARIRNNLIKSKWAPGVPKM